METLQEIISAARQQESWNVTHEWNYGPIDYLQKHVIQQWKGTKEYMRTYYEFMHHVHEVTDYETYFVWEHKNFDIYVDADLMVCNMRIAFPEVSFREVCRLLQKHEEPHQHTNAISLSLVPDIMLVESDDAETREKFRERHEKFYKLSSYWLKDGNLNTHREEDLRKKYDAESLALHFMISLELYYYWSDERAALCLEQVQQVRPEITMDDLRRVYEETKHGVSELYE
jgi:hypothetical protein